MLGLIIVFVVAIIEGVGLVKGLRLNDPASWYRPRY